MVQELLSLFHIQKNVNQKYLMFFIYYDDNNKFGTNVFRPWYSVTGVSNSNLFEGHILTK